VAGKVARTRSKVRLPTEKATGNGTSGGNTCGCFPYWKASWKKKKKFLEKGGKKKFWGEKGLRGRERSGGKRGGGTLLKHGRKASVKVGCDNLRSGGGNFRGGAEKKKGDMGEGSVEKE